MNTKLTKLMVLACWLAPLSFSRGENAPDKKDVVIDEYIYVDLADEPTDYFHNAHENFIKRDYKEAAAELRTGATYLKLEATRFESSTKKLLLDSVTELEDLATACENGTVTRVEKLENAFARAHHALAVGHHLKAAEALAKKDEKLVAAEMQAARNHLSHGLAWAKEDLVPDTENVLKDTAFLSGKIVAGGGWAAEEVGKALDFCGKEINTLGKKVAALGVKTGEKKE